MRVDDGLKAVLGTDHESIRRAFAAASTAGIGTVDVAGLYLEAGAAVIRRGWCGDEPYLIGRALGRLARAVYPELRVEP